jgi:hypothetical protein
LGDFGFEGFDALGVSLAFSVAYFSFYAGCE